MKKPITRDISRGMDWHGHVAEYMVRDHFRDRYLDPLLGDVHFFEENDVNYAEFEYKQPKRLEDRGVDWLDRLESDVDIIHAGHGTYWESSPWILANGAFMASDDDMTFGEHEYHKAKGVYVTPQFDAWAEHYSWPCNVFGNKAFYGIGSLGGKSQEDQNQYEKKRNLYLLALVGTCLW